ncbi:uncharacterized protein J2T13_005271 [Paenibacillus sp. DS2015]|uniref:radical SAM protein n=1 Tax=Paenibacillus sp. DS2015 TaxID=3373917 RepID=UPI003D23681A
MSDRGFFFTTKKGNSYYYDDYSGNVRFQENKENNKFMFGNSKPQDISINKEELTSYLESNGGNQLILLTTESCNIRCEYCIYSGNYSNQRTHNTDFMDISIAKKAVEQYLYHFKLRKSKHLFDNPLIAFYGGESLLNFKLIKEVIAFSEEIYKNKILFSTTTNATLLNDDKIHFFARNKFILSISLNGDKQENDRLRVYGDGSGTYDIVLKNMKKIQELYPDYYKEYCQILITIDTGTDLLRMRDFFKNNRHMLPKIARISQIGASFTDWYQRYSSEDRTRFINSLEELREIYILQIQTLDIKETEEFLNILFSIPIFSILNRSNNIPFNQRRPQFLPFTGACVPGDKIAVDSTGNLHVCERINQSRPIGNIDDWLSIPLISDMLEDYQKKVAEDCVNCPIQSLCELCYPGVIDENGNFDKINMTPDCHNMRTGIQTEFGNIWNMLENGIDANKLLPNLNS